MKAYIDTSSVKVVLDTNALMVPEQFGVDIFSELLRLGYAEWLVPASVLGELRSLATRADKGKDKIAARVALGLARAAMQLERTIIMPIRQSKSLP